MTSRLRVGLPILGLASSYRLIPFQSGELGVNYSVRMQTCLPESGLIRGS